MIGIDPLLVDPEQGDFRLQPGSPAEGYGCQTFPDRPLGLPHRGRGIASSRPTTEHHPIRGDRLSGERALDVSGLIDEDTVWDADTVRVQGHVEVADTVTLTISPGVRVEFQDYYSLTVRGRLLAIGEPEDPVQFTSDDPDSFVVDSTLTGAWAGIRFPFTSEINEPSRLEYCVIEYAKNAGDSLRGGALQVIGFSKLSLENSILRHNVADFGGAMVFTHYASPEIKGCLIVENVAFNGGSALHCLDAYPRLINCTIVANEDRNPHIVDPAAAIYAHISKPQLTGSILRSNPSNYFMPTQILYGKSYYTTWSNIGDDWPGEGNIDEDPLFMGGGDHPYCLQTGSPCVNTGPPDSTGLHLPMWDLAGSPRFREGRLDMGAYEGNPETVGVGATLGISRLQPNHPNPFGPATTIRFRLAQRHAVHLVVIDVTGRHVTVLADDVYGAGLHEIWWDGLAKHGRPVSSGIYWVRLDAGAVSESQKLVLLR